MINKKKVADVISAVVLFPLILLFLLFVLIYTPVDYLIYKASRYYKDTREKYSWMCATSYYVEFYNLIKKENLPIDYYRCKSGVPMTGYGFFVYKDTLILVDYNHLCYDEENHVWQVEVDDEYVDIKNEVEKSIQSCNDLLGNNACKKAIVMVDKDVYSKYPAAEYENIKFLPISHKDVEAIRAALN